MDEQLVKIASILKMAYNSPGETNGALGNNMAKEMMGKALREQNPVEGKLTLPEARSDFSEFGYDPNKREGLVNTTLKRLNLGNPLESNTIYKGNTQGGSLPSTMSAAQQGVTLTPGDPNGIGMDENAKRLMGKALREQNPIKERLTMPEVTGDYSDFVYSPEREKLIDTNLGRLNFDNPVMDKEFGFSDNLRWDIHNKTQAFNDKIGPYVEKLRGGLGELGGKIDGHIDSATELINQNPLYASLGAGGLGLGALGALGAGAFKSLKKPETKTAGKISNINTETEGEENMKADMNLVKTAAILGNKTAQESIKVAIGGGPGVVPITPGSEGSLGNYLSKIKDFAAGYGQNSAGQGVVGGTGGAAGGSLAVSPGAQAQEAAQEAAAEAAASTPAETTSMLGSIDPQTAAMLGLGAAGIGAAGYGAHKMMQGRGEPKTASAEETNSHKDTVLGILKLAEAGVKEASDYLVATETLMPGMLDELIK